MEKEIYNIDDERFKQRANLILVKLLFKILYNKNSITKKEFEIISNQINRTSNY